MADWNPAIWLLVTVVYNSKDHALENHVPKTIDNDLNVGLLSFRHLEMVWPLLAFSYRGAPPEAAPPTNILGGRTTEELA